MSNITDISALGITPNSSLRRAIACIENNDAKIALAIDEEGRLIDTITDGDIRRAMLDGVDLDGDVILLRKRRTSSWQPVTAHVDSEPAVMLRMMKEASVRQLPLLDDAQRVVRLVTLQELTSEDTFPVQAVVMAGGYGTRLRPLTEQLPKPMLPVGGRPVLERIIDQLRDAGINSVSITTHYKAEAISQHFGDGSDFGVRINYVNEGQPLGTAGALSLLDVSDEPLLVINGDIVTGVDFRAMMDFHVEHQADMSVAVRQHELQVPYGVIETDGETIVKILEKPTIRHFINAGIYLLDRDVTQTIPNENAYDMTDLISKLITDGRRVISFPIREYWLDIGQHADHKQAEEDLREGKV